MQPRQEKRHIVDILFVLALFGVFALSALILVILGANVYKQTVSSMSQNYETRTACSYLTEKIRQNDVYDSIRLDSLEGSQALVFTQEIGDSSHETYVYFHDGALKELFVQTNSNMDTNSLYAGTTIINLKAFDISYINDKLLEINLTTTTNETKTVYVSLHSTGKEDSL